MKLDFSLFGSGNKGLIGLDISSSSIKMVELGGDVLNPRVERYALELLPKDAVSQGKINNLEAVAEAVRKAWRRLGTSTKNVAMALPAATVITKKIVAPANLTEEQMEIQVESEASQYIPFPLEEVNLDFQIIGPAPGGVDEVEVMLAASKKEMVEDRVAIADSAGLVATVVDHESYAALAAFARVQEQLPDKGNNLIIALVDVGASQMNLTVLKNGQSIYSRDQEFGGNVLTQAIARQYGMSFDEAESAKRTAALPEGAESDLIRPFVKDFSEEVSRALQFFYTSTQYNRVDNVVISGGSAVLQDMDQAVAARVQVPTIVANPFVDLELSDKIRSRTLTDDAPALMVAFGLAFRRFDE